MSGFRLARVEGMNVSVTTRADLAMLRGANATMRSNNNDQAG